MFSWSGENIFRRAMTHDTASLASVCTITISFPLLLGVYEYLVATVSVGLFPGDVASDGNRMAIWLSPDSSSQFHHDAPFVDSFLTFAVLSASSSMVKKRATKRAASGLLPTSAPQVPCDAANPTQTNEKYLLHGETRVYLMSKKIGHEQAKGIAEELATNTTANYLDLGHNSIGDIGAKLIAGALSKNQTLATIYLTFNEIGPVGVSAIAKALCENRTLTFLC
jgi:Leucine Rich repeat